MPGMREALEAALDEHAAPDTPTSTDLSSPEHGEVVAEARAVDNPVDNPAPAGERIRDSLGRFVPKAGDTVTGDGNAAAPAQATPAETPAATPEQAATDTPAEAAQPIPAPHSWAAGAREEWGKLSPNLQQYISQREQAMQRFVGETGQAREFAQRFNEMVQPFIPAIQAEGVDPLTATQNLLQIGSRLRFGTPAEKAATVAQVVSAYGVDIQALDNALAGLPVPQAQQGFDPSIVQREVQQALAPLMQAAQARQSQAVAAAQEHARNELAAFTADPKNEFFGDVRPIMADLVETANRHGRPITLAEAYDAACRLHPEVSRVIMARQQAATARDLTTTAQRAKSAAVQVKGAPQPAVNAQPTSLRGAIEASLEAHSGY